MIIIYCVHHSIANSSPHALPRGIASPGLPKIPPISEPEVRSIGYRVINTPT
ncbi:hypothetical protein [Paraburkholderia sediminicola]|uniref:hypothetical protein n=1 Tax=Paraburkholderia sediminicola TaxID=458836 RepID=UPI0038B77923